MSSQVAIDYYALLGVHAAASDQELRNAWRRLAARWHPDRAGDEATARFQQISAAYDVLSDPLARAAYDRRRRAANPASAVAPRPPATAPASTPRHAARPQAPAVMISRLCKHLSVLFATGAARIDDHDGAGFVTLVFREDEAAQGGMITIPMNVDVWCPQCAADRSPSTARPAPACARCGGARTVPGLFSAWLAVPPGVTSGEVLAPSVELPGMVDPVRFRVHVRPRA
jgi:hypothetical protein